MNGGEIEDDLAATLPNDAPGYATVTRWLRQERLSRFSEPDHDLTDDPQVDEIDQGILSALAIQSFGSVRYIARLASLSCSTVHSHLTRSPAFRVGHLRWIPSVLTPEQKLNQVRDSQALLKMLQAQQKRSWHDIVTLDESWFYLSTDHERIWPARGETPPDQERHTIRSPKSIFTIVWGLTGFHVVKVLPKGGSFNVNYDTNEILSEIACWREAQGGGTNRELVIHSDNARPILLAEHCDISKLAGWFELLILNTRQISHCQTFSYSVLSKHAPGTPFRDWRETVGRDISPPGYH
jgi:hypothetical protein